VNVVVPAKVPAEARLVDTEIVGSDENVPDPFFSTSKIADDPVGWVVSANVTASNSTSSGKYTLGPVNVARVPVRPNGT
jgi:hypothetical protein